VPWIIGAKKYLPNFNEFVMENIVGVTRRLQLTRNTNSSTLTGTNQMYLMDLKSSLGVDLWNSYNDPYNGQVSCVLREYLSTALTNDDRGNFSLHPGVSQPMMTGFTNIFSTNLWVGGRFLIPLNTTVLMLTNAVYRSPDASGGAVPAGFTAPCLIPTNYFNSIDRTVLFETNRFGPERFQFPEWTLLVTNQLQVFMLGPRTVDGYFNVIDYVQFQQIESHDLNTNLFSDTWTDLEDGSNDGVWNTNVNPHTGVPYGIENQIRISRGLPGYTDPPVEDGNWRSDSEAGSLGGTKAQQQNAFYAFFLPYGATRTFTENGVSRTVSNLLSSVQAPYSPWRRVITYNLLQANDPLVHYLASDMKPSYKMVLPSHVDPDGQFMTLSNLDLGRMNKNYQPWGGNPNAGTGDNAGWAARTERNQALKDPLVYGSDDWDFPTNKFPNVGWLGRVHRGTSWQTVYLKASDVLSQVQISGTGISAVTNHVGTNNWTTWTGNGSTFDAANTRPVEDRLLFDVFTTALNDNASRGTLSVNQTNLAAWSALFSGVQALSNSAPYDGVLQGRQNAWPRPALATAPFTLQPAGFYDPAFPLPALVRIVQGIVQKHSTFTNADGLVGAFEHAGDILSVPQLTERSPFISTNGYIHLTNVNDEIYEWLPQQVMSLLRCSSSPRYVIYCYGQALKPAPDGIYTGGGNYFGMITNYQVVSETATRAVVRFDSLRTNAVGAMVTFTKGTWYTNWYNLPAVTNNGAVIEQFNILPPD